MEKYVFSQLREVPRLVKKEIYPKNKPLKRRPTFLKLKKYVDEFIQSSSDERWVLLTGLRGVGKTTVLYQLYDYLTNGRKINQEDILYISVDHMKTLIESDLFSVINTFVEKVHNSTIVDLDKRLIVLVDEAHYDKEWSTKIKSIYDRTKNIFFVITGSSALSLNLSVDVLRRINKEIMPPLNLSDYLLLKYENFFQPRNTSITIRDLIFYGLAKLDEAKKIERQLKQKFNKLPKSLDMELSLFLKSGGFGFSIHNNDVNEIMKRTMSVIDKVITDDLTLIKDIEKSTQQIAYKILGYLALKKAGEISHNKLGILLSKSPDVIRYLLDAMEKTEIIFSVKPSSKQPVQKTTKPWKYYFSTPTIHNAIYRITGGDYSSEYMGLLWEDVVASILYRMSKTLVKPRVNLFYDSNEGGVDFILHDLLQQRSIPIEVGSGDKGFKQLRNAINRYKASHGILVCDCEKIEAVDNIIKIPITTFLFA